MATLNCTSAFGVHGLTCHLTARFTRELLQYVHKSTLAWSMQHFTVRSKNRPWTTENSYRAIASLMSTSGRLLQIIMSPGERDLSSFSSTTLTAVFILITLQLLFQVLSFILLIVDQKLTFPVFIYKSVEQFSTCFTLLTQVVLDFVGHDHFGYPIIQVIVRS